jgi:hypothetical protein
MPEDDPFQDRDIVWRLRQYRRGPWQDAVAEIDRLRTVEERYRIDREEYAAWWTRWMATHAGLGLVDWLRAYSSAMPAAHPDGPGEVERILAALDARIATTADELESKTEQLAATLRELRKVRAERDEARRALCRAVTNGGETLPVHFLLWKAVEEAERRGWDYYAGCADGRATDERDR